MGVTKLWELLAPSGRRVALESLANKRLAIDTSIWLMSFESVRDEEGRVIPNAHLKGLFHRICKMLFWGIKPIFVFDGATPQLKKSTVSKRKIDRSKNAFKKLAKKILDGRLKQAKSTSKTSPSPDKLATPADSQASPSPLSRSTSSTLSSSELLDSEELDDLLDDSGAWWNFDAPADPSIDYSDYLFEDSPSDATQNSSEFEKLLFGQVDKGVFENLPPEVKMEVIVNIRRQMYRQARKKSRQIHELSPNPTAFSQIQINKLLRFNEVSKKMKEIKSTMPAAETHKVASEEGTEFIFYENSNSQSESPGSLKNSNSLNNSIDSPINVDSVDTSAGFFDDEEPEIELLSKKDKLLAKKSLSETLKSPTSSSTSSTPLTKTPPKVRDPNSNGSKNDFPVPTFRQTLSTPPKPPKFIDLASDEPKPQQIKISINPDAVKPSSLFEGVFESPTKSQSSHSEDMSEVSNIVTRNDMYKFLHKNSRNEKDFSTREELVAYLESEDLISDPNRSADTNSNASSSEKQKKKGAPKYLLNEILDIPNESVNGISFDFDNDKPSEATRLSYQQQMEMEALLLSRESRDQVLPSRNLPTEMLTDCQEILQLFGIPYVLAPFEAEAQCARLLELNLVDGVITDDSDIFLFGGDHVYRHMFNKDEFVEYYQMSDIQKELGLGRNELVNLALLLGSDYTDGVRGVGVVTAMEIIGAFPGEKGLHNFEKWFNGNESPTKNQSEKKLDKLRGLRGRIKLSEEFPSDDIRNAYLHPMVDESEEKFQWSRPNLDLLRDFAKRKLTWGPSRVDELILPVLKRYDSRTGVQTRIDGFFISQSKVPEKISSSRLKDVIANMTGKSNENSTSSSGPVDLGKSTKEKKNPKSKKRKQNEEKINFGGKKAKNSEVI